MTAKFKPGQLVEFRTLGHRFADDCRCSIVVENMHKSPSAHLTVKTGDIGVYVCVWMRDCYESVVLFRENKVVVCDNNICPYVENGFLEMLKRAGVK